MPSVTMHAPGDRAEKPSETIVKAANAIFHVVDENGRTIGFKKLGVLDKMRLFETVGPENVKNEAYFGWASLAAHAVEIDGTRLSPMATKRELEARLMQLGEEGLNAIALGVTEHLMTDLGDDARERIKNALSTPGSD